MTGDVPVVRSAAYEALFWQTMKDTVAREYEKARALAQAEMERAGSEKQRVRDTGGVDLGSLGIGEGKWTAEITDRAALLDWVTDERPDELWQPPLEIRASYLGAIMAKVAAGEQEIPGMRRVWRDGGLTVRANGVAKDRTRDMLKALAETAQRKLGAKAEPGPVRYSNDGWEYPSTVVAPDIDTYDEGVWSGVTEPPNEEDSP